MASIKIEGTSFPAEAGLTSPYKVTLPQQSFANFTIHNISWQLQNGVILATFDVDRFDDTYRLSETYKFFYDLTASYIDLVVYKTGKLIRFVLTHCTIDDGPRKPICIQMSKAIHLSTAVDTDIDQFHKLQMQLLSDGYAFKAMRDFIEALTVPNTSVINCARVIDGIRRSILDVEDKRAGWAALHSTLNVEEGYITYISTISAGPRHAKFDYIDSEITTNVCMRTWKIFDRFIVYLRSNKSKPLSLDDYPLLTGKD